MKPKKYTPEGWRINIRKKRKLHEPGNNAQHYQIKDEIRHAQKCNPDKVFYLQKIKFDDDHEELRFCYYNFRKDDGESGKWVVGQYAPVVPLEDFKAIVDEARSRCWI